MHQTVTNIQNSINEQTFQVSLQHDTSKLVQSEEGHKSVTRDPIKFVTKIVDESGKQTCKSLKM